MSNGPRADLRPERNGEAGLSTSTSPARFYFSQGLCDPGIKGRAPAGGFVNISERPPVPGHSPPVIQACLSAQGAQIGLHSAALPPNWGPWGHHGERIAPEGFVRKNPIRRTEEGSLGGFFSLRLNEGQPPPARARWSIASLSRDWARRTTIALRRAVLSPSQKPIGWITGPGDLDRRWE